MLNAPLLSTLFSSLYRSHPFSLLSLSQWREVVIVDAEFFYRVREREEERGKKITLTSLESERERTNEWKRVRGEEISPSPLHAHVCVGERRREEGSREREIQGEKERTIGREEDCRREEKETKKKEKEKERNPPGDRDLCHGRERGCAPLAMEIFCHERERWREREREIEQ